MVTPRLGEGRLSCPPNSFLLMSLLYLSAALLLQPLSPLFTDYNLLEMKLYLLSPSLYRKYSFTTFPLGKRRYTLIFMT